MISEPTTITNETTISSTLVVQSARVPTKHSSKQHSRYNSEHQHQQENSAFYDKTQLTNNTCISPISHISSSKYRVYDAPKPY